MILYALRCSQHHQFEAWFRNSETFDKQAAVGEVSCPLCGDTHIAKAPMAPRIGKSRDKEAAAPAPEASAPQNPPAPSGQVPASAQDTPPASGAGSGETISGPPVSAAEAAALRQILTALRHEVEKRCDYVGDRFAEEARRIHYNETDPRPIYGEATANEAEALADEGVTFQRIPWLPRTES